MGPCLNAGRGLRGAAQAISSHPPPILSPWAQQDNSQASQGNGIITPFQKTG